MAAKHCTGVYLIRNTVNGKVYVGSAAKSLGARWRKHVRELKAGRHFNKYLQAAWIKYGECCFEFTVLEFCAPADCICVEQRYIDSMKATDKECGYNFCPTAGSMLGTTYGPEVRAKISAANRGKTLSPEGRAKVSAAHRGRTHSPEVRARMSAAKRGKALSPEARANVAAAAKRRWESPEHRAKVSAALRGRKCSPETRAKISAALRGKKATPESIAKMKASHKFRKPYSAEHRAKLAAAMRRRMQSAEYIAKNKLTKSAAPNEDAHKEYSGGG